MSTVFLLVLHFLERFQQRQVLVFPAQALDVGAGDGFQQNPFRRGDHGGLRAVLNLKFPAELAGNDHLPFRAETDGVQL